MNLTRYLLPYGWVRWREVARQLLELGLPPGRSHALGMVPGTLGKLRQLNLDLLPPGTFSGISIVVDIGAHAGDWSAGVMEFCRPSELICVEPNPELAAFLRERFGKRPEVRVRECALGAQSGSAEFRISHDSCLSSLRRPAEAMDRRLPGHFDVARTIKVDIRTLDEIAADLDHVSLLKIDAQGSEREVLAGARATLAKANFVLLEVNFQSWYEGEADFCELDALMRHHGFHIGNFSRPKVLKGRALYADFLYARPDT